MLENPGIPAYRSGLRLNPLPIRNLASILSTFVTYGDAGTASSGSVQSATVEYPSPVCARRSGVMVELV